MAKTRGIAEQCDEGRIASSEMHIVTVPRKVYISKSLDRLAYDSATVSLRGVIMHAWSMKLHVLRIYTTDSDRAQS